MIGIHSHTGTAISPTRLSMERYKWLHETHRRLHNHMDFTQDLLGLMSHYHSRAKSLSPRERPLKLMAENWAIPTLLRQAIESTFLTTTEFFGSPLNCSISDDITYCSIFSKDTVFEAVINSSQFR